MATRRSKKPAVASENSLTVAVPLLPGEALTLADEQRTQPMSDEQLNSRYVKGEVRIVTEQARYPLTGILKMLQDRVELPDGTREFRYKLDPEYQRRHRWDDARKSRLIESFLMNVPVPPVFLYERELARFEVMDGRQRLTALSEFFDGKLVLTGLQYWPDLDGRTYETLPAKIRDGIDRRYISSIILLKETASNAEEETRLKKLVFERLNSGGVKLSSQETRNAVYTGDLNQLCLELALNSHFRSLWRIPDDVDSRMTEIEDADEPTVEGTKAGHDLYQRMEDVEIVLRFFAYRQIGSFKGGLNELTRVLDSFMKEGNRSFGQPVLAEFRRLFVSTVEFVFHVLGDDAFCVTWPVPDPPKGGSRKPRRPLKVVYDAVMYAASHPEIAAHHSQLRNHPTVVRTELAQMFRRDSEDGAHVFSGRATNTPQVHQRNALVYQAFLAAIDKVSAT